jgi:hypothetical protein
MNQNKLHNMMMRVTGGGGGDDDGSFVPSHLQLCICLYVLDGMCSLNILFHELAMEL